jgi:hypothetical protein
MVITGKRIRNLDKHFRSIPKRKHVVIALSDLTRFARRLYRIGFSSNLTIGETVLPPADFGPISKFNAEGTYQVHRNRPMETCYRLVEWHWQEWNGRYDRVDRSKIVEVPYKRYPRTFISPEGIELTVAKATTQDMVLVTPPIEFNTANTTHLLHRINLFLEIFGECSILTKKLQHLYRAPLRRLNWHVLPPGKMPWRQLESRVKPIIDKVPKGKREVIRNQLETINKHQPDFVAIGRAGFRGYIIFGFPKRNIYVLESIYHGNATYVFKNDWERLSQMTKAEILNQNLQEDRMIHRLSWYEKIKKLLS